MPQAVLALVTLLLFGVPTPLSPPVERVLAAKADINLQFLGAPDRRWYGLAQAVTKDLKQAGIQAYTQLVSNPGQYEITIDMVVSPDRTVVMWRVQYRDQNGVQHLLYRSGADYIQPGYATALRYMNSVVPNLARALRLHEEQVVEAIKKVLGYQPEL